MDTQSYYNALSGLQRFEDDQKEMVDEKAEKFEAAKEKILTGTEPVSTFAEGVLAHTLASKLGLSEKVASALSKGDVAGAAKEAGKELTERATTAANNMVEDATNSARAAVSDATDAARAAANDAAATAQTAAEDAAATARTAATTAEQATARFGTRLTQATRAVSNMENDPEDLASGMNSGDIMETDIDNVGNSVRTTATTAAETGGETAVEEGAVAGGETAVEGGVIAAGAEAGLSLLGPLGWIAGAGLALAPLFVKLFDKPHHKAKPIPLENVSIQGGLAG